MDKSLRGRLNALKSGTDKVKTYRSILSSQMKSLTDDSTTLKYRSDLYQKCSEIFKKWLEDSMERNVDSMAELTTKGLHHIIHDQSLVFKIKQESKFNRISMKFILEQNGVEGDPLGSYGGGAAVIISLILRLAVMKRMGMANLLILDESMVALANAYVPSAALFMRKLAEEAGINILMVTHNPEFLNGAHIAYEGHKDDSLKLRRIKTVSQ